MNNPIDDLRKTIESIPSEVLGKFGSRIEDAWGKLQIQWPTKSDWSWNSNSGAQDQADTTPKRGGVLEWLFPHNESGIDWHRETGPGSVMSSDEYHGKANAGGMTSEWMNVVERKLDEIIDLLKDILAAVDEVPTLKAARFRTAEEVPEGKYTSAADASWYPLGRVPSIDDYSGMDDDFWDVHTIKPPKLKGQLGLESRDTEIPGLPFRETESTSMALAADAPNDNDGDWGSLLLRIAEAIEQLLSLASQGSADSGSPGTAMIPSNGPQQIFWESPLAGVDDFNEASPSMQSGEMERPGKWNDDSGRPRRHDKRDEIRGDRWRW